nr:MAG TPA: hypothetical protein [Caudoviricetes sp.]
MPGYARDVSRGAFIGLDNILFCAYNIYRTLIMARTRLERAPYIRVFLFNIQHPSFLCGFSYKICKISLVIYTGNKIKDVCLSAFLGLDNILFISYPICTGALPQSA